MAGETILGGKLMKNLAYLRSRQRRGRWFHYYRRAGQEVSLGVHGLHPDDPRVFAAYCAAHAHYEHQPAEATRPSSGTFAWAVESYKASRGWSELAESSQKSRSAILRQYIEIQGDRPLSTISSKDIDGALYSKGGHAAVNHYKSLKPVFEHVKRLGIISKNPMETVKVARPKTRGHRTTTIEEIEQFQDFWKPGTTERLVFDLALFTGAARVDLARLGHHNVAGDVLRFRRQKSDALSEVPITNELRQLIERLPTTDPAFILTSRGKPFTQAGLGNFFQRAASQAGIEARLHGLRKAFCVYWAEKGASSRTMMAMAGHMTLSEVERYTRDANNTRLVKLLINDT
ncbi:hypothetical protein DC366_11115 [Pelagivirga sediminicola]|uniref:Tyr recombinase domain-containing protein n=1 Tax=Pelagivirga sediminicola TaxID=2170575 RepID=A0A2T7G718_9RHOB|nr:tyrosine-type recombinase/integrase [Pelagivirga sediminicola]PVA10187.1 hypothetical protein DC366_11115 [Pelagivirga sediminicola]